MVQVKFIFDGLVVLIHSCIGREGIESGILMI